MIRQTIAIALLTTTLTGCLSTKMYVDPTLAKVAYSDLTPPAEKHPVQLLYEFQTKGSLNAAAIKETQPMATNALQKSNMFSQVVSAPGMSDYKLFITINNVADMKEAQSSGVKTGLTLGLAGSTVTDGYLCKAIYQAPGKEPVVKNYQHAIHTTIGNTEAPKGLQPLKPQVAVQQVVEDLILNAVKDLNAEGAL